jgi:phosphohistidine phosphatase
MKKLYLIRHAKASKDRSGTDDHKRPLIETGIKRTQKVIQYFLDNKVSFDCMITSHASRAMDTAKLIAKGLGYPINDIVCDKRIYEMNESIYFTILSALNDSVTDVALIGHNPDITTFSNLFLDEKIINLPTSGVVCIEFDTNTWSEIKRAKHKVLFIISPKIL